MTRALDVRPQAEADIADAYDYYHGYSTDLASDFIDELDGVLARVRDNPAHFQPVHRDLHRALLRRFPYAVFYSFTDQVVVVFAVLHQASDPERWQRP